MTKKLDKPHENTDEHFLAVQRNWQNKEDKKVNSSESQEKRAQDKAILDAAYKKVFDSPDGLLVLKDLENKLRYRQSCFTTDQRQTDFALGQQSSVIYIHDKLKD